MQRPVDKIHISFCPFYFEETKYTIYPKPVWFEERQPRKTPIIN